MEESGLSGVAVVRSAQLLVVVGLDRTRLLWRSGHVGKAWVRFSRSARGAENPLPLIKQLSETIVDLASEQDVTLSWGQEGIVANVLGRSVGTWLAGGGDDQIIQALGDKWQFTPYGELLVESVQPVRYKGTERTAMIKSCAQVAGDWNDARSRADRESLWEMLCEDFGEVPPASDLLELLSWPASWWLVGGPEGAFVFSDDNGAVWPTRQALEVFS